MKNLFLTPILLFATYYPFAQTWITNVTVADVEKQVLIPDQTVVISNGLIADMQPAKKMKVPENAV
ncbi:MAG: hypothetical protein MUE99_09115, partial [Chitinophagaceae bacterium]|nr:hypothetical protein [Chitinophagaceae bacterium]